MSEISREMQILLSLPNDMDPHDWANLAIAALDQADFPPVKLEEVARMVRDFTDIGWDHENQMFVPDDDDAEEE